MAEPGLIVLGPRKRKVTSRVTDNGDPLLRNKKARQLADCVPSAQDRHQSVPGIDTNAVATRRQGSPNSIDITNIDESEDEEGQGIGNRSIPPTPNETDGEDEQEELDKLDEPEESAEDELGKCLIKVISHHLTAKHVERLMKLWNTPIYAFFKPTPTIDYSDGRRVHTFECGAKICKGRGKHGRHVRRFLDTSDSTSTSNLRRHAKICYSQETVAAAAVVKDVYAARDVLKKASLRDGSITAAFERVGKEQLTFSNRQHTKTETRYVSCSGATYNLIHVC